MKGLICTMLAGLGMLTILSCSENEEERHYEDMRPETRAINLTDTQKEMVQQNNAFALNLFKEVYRENGAKSLSFSPMGVTFMLGMVGNGTDEVGRKEITDVMGFGHEGIEGVNRMCQRLMEDAPKVDPAVTLEIANAVIANKNITLKKAFEQTVRKYYDAKASSMDFTDPKTMYEINSWVKSKSHGKIEKVIDQISPLARAILLNSIYFEGGWRYKFDKDKTISAKFLKECGEAQEVQMMCTQAYVNYAEDDDCRMLCLPYGCGEKETWNMHLIMPKPGKTVEDVMERLDCHKWADLRDAEKSFYLDLMIPKFRTNNKTDLVNVLKKMGVGFIFERGGMGQMSDNPTLLISLMEQHAGIEVDETGAKMATVTVAEVLDGAVNPRNPDPTEFRAERPFIYLISENSSGAIFFTGVFHGE